jgi:hypothetical protein
MTYYTFSTQTGDIFDVDQRLWASPFKAIDMAIWEFNNIMMEGENPYGRDDFDIKFDFENHTIHVEKADDELLAIIYEMRVARHD